MNTYQSGHMSDMSETRWAEVTENKTCTSKDGIQLFYQTIGSGDKVMILANGLGGRLYSWAPFLDYLSSDYKLICWDYRGLFDSETPQKITDLSIARHAQDIKAILDNESVERVVLAGWSMGVQVSLEFASHHQDMVDGLILLNGTHGHTLETAFQPLFRHPYSHKYFHEVIDKVLASSKYIDLLCKIKDIKKIRVMFGRFLKFWWKNEDLETIAEWFINDIFNKANFPLILKLVQELDAHSVYHHLRDIHKPVLILSGGSDFLTPSYQSVEMARKLKNSKHIHFRIAGHFLLLEKSNEIMGHVRLFLSKL